MRLYWDYVGNVLKCYGDPSGFRFELYWFPIGLYMDYMGFYKLLLDLCLVSQGFYITSTEFILVSYWNLLRLYLESIA